MRKIYLSLIVLLLYACDNGKKLDERALLEKLDSVKLDEPALSEDVISDIIQQIPAPLEISVLLKETGTEYNNSLLNPTNNLSKYNNNYKKALNLGIYGTDLGYTNIYEKNQDGLFYLSAIKELADDLSIGQFFDFNMIKRLATNSKNLDSLLLITTKNFNNINSYLQGQQRSNLSVLLLTGGWLEALHITCQVYSQNPTNQELKERIGEQKIILDNIMLLLSLYSQSDTNVAQLEKNLLELQKIFNQIEITYTYEESTMKEVNGVLMIVDNSSSKINITDQNVKDITSVTENVRNSIIN